MLPLPQEEESKTNGNIADYAPIASSMNMLLQPIAENLEDHRPSVTNITTLQKFTLRKSVHYSAKKRFKVRKHRKRKKKVRDEPEEEEDDDETYDIWNRPNIDNLEANNDGKQLIRNEYDGIHENIDQFLDLLLENETECDKLAQLMCNKKLTSKDLSKKNRSSSRYELFDVLRLADDDDDGGLNPDDYDIDMREMEHLFQKLNNNMLHSFMSCYYADKVPFEARQPFPMGQIETDITYERKMKMKKNANYIAEHRRKNKQRLREKHIKKKVRTRKKRRKEKKFKMKLAQKKLAALNAHLSSQLAPDTLNILFHPLLVDDDDNDNNDDEKEREEVKIISTLDDEALRTDDEALGGVSNTEAKERIKKMRLERAASRRQIRKHTDRHSAAMQSNHPVIQQLSNLLDEETSAMFDDETSKEVAIAHVFDEEQLSMVAPPAMSKDYDGSVKRYARPIKMDQVEKVSKYVLFGGARQYFKKQYLENLNVTKCVEKKLEAKTMEYSQIKAQIEFKDEDDEEEVARYINQCRKRDLDVFVAQHSVLKQQAMLQLMSMGVDLEDLEDEGMDEDYDVNEISILRAFKEGIDGQQIAAEDKLINHDENDSEVRMCAIVYDSDDDKANDNRWKWRSKWIQKALTDFVTNEVETKKYGAKPWKKLHSKYVYEFVAKFCGHYADESRPVAWKRIWHQNCNEKNEESWPDSWMDLFNCGKLNINELNDEKDAEEEDGDVRWVKCMKLIAEDKECKFGALFDDNPEMLAFYKRVLSNIPKLALNLEDVALPKFVWKLNAAELSKYGTYLLANWKQSSQGKVTTSSQGKERFPFPQFKSDIEQMRFNASQKWFVYRLRYWEAQDIMDFLDDSEGKESSEWFGTNDYDSDKFTLLEDRICIQNDHCYGAPSLFLWTHDFCNDTGPTCSAIRVRNYGVSRDIASTDPHLQEEKSVFNLNAPLVPTGRMACDGPLRSGSKLAIGARDPLDLDDINGIIAIDAFIPPIFNLSVYDDADTLFYNWNRVNHSATNCDRASSKQMAFVNKNEVGADPLCADENNILKSWNESSANWVDFKNYPVFDADHDSHASVLSNAFFFNNLLARSFHFGASKNIAKINYPPNWQSAIFKDADDVNHDEWILSFGFTHPRPIAPEKYAVLLYKKDCIDVRITTDTQKMDTNEANSNQDYYDFSINEDDIEFELNDSATKYKWSEERLEIVLYFEIDGKQKAFQLFSTVIRTDFKHRDCFYQEKMHKKFIFTENNFMSHVVIVEKHRDGQIKCYLDGRIVCKTTVSELVGGHRNATTNILKQSDDHLFLVAHKPGAKEGRVHGLFHGYLYGIALHACALQPFELNTMYRQLCVHRDLHVVKMWWRNKHQLSNAKYKQFL